MRFFKKWLARRQFKKKTVRAAQECDEIYREIPSFHLAKQARSDENQYAYEFIYGEIDYYSFAKLLGQCQINANTVFYDLGSGAGKAVIFASLLFEFKALVGIEKLLSLYQGSIKALNQAKASKIRFDHADLLHQDLIEANLIFVNAATFIGEFWTQVLSKLERLKQGTQIIVISKQLPAESFKLVYEGFLPMSWGVTRASVYRRN